MIVKIKNLIPGNGPGSTTAKMWIEFNFPQHCYVDEGPADFVIWNGDTDMEEVERYPASVSLHFDLSHASEDKATGWSNVPWINRPFNNDFAVIEVVDYSFLHRQKLLSSDFLFNRTKAYYTQYQFSPNVRRWYMIDETDFLLQPISTAEEKTRIFLSPSKIGRPNLPYRKRLVNSLQQHREKGYLGDWNSDAGPVYGQGLVPNRFNPTAKKVKDIKEFVNQLRPDMIGYSPVHNAYYNETFISIYGETLEWGTSQVLTEKTLDPLIKGHFILPFGAPGLIQHVINKGYRIPKFINYSYDLISNNDDRYYAYITEVNRLLSISLDEWRQLWIDNQHILNYNRNIFFERDYDRIDFSKLIQSKQ